jgi:hypothetical protein
MKNVSACAFNFFFSGVFPVDARISSMDFVCGADRGQWDENVPDSSGNDSRHHGTVNSAVGDGANSEGNFILMEPRSIG